jgi:PAS domain S-box-containing protein
MGVRSDRFLIAGGGVVAVLLLAIAIGSWINTRRVWEDTAVVEHTQTVLASLDAVLSIALDAETGQRGFLLTGEARYLGPHEAAASRLRQQIETVAELTADNPAQQARIPELQRLAGVKLAELDETIAAYRARGPDAARAIVRTDRGKLTMDAMRAIVATMQADESQLIVERRAQSAHSYRSAVASAFLSACIGIAVLGLLLWTTARNLRERAAAASALFDQKELLETTLASIGDAVITTDPAGRVRFLNTIAQQLTGWTQQDAAGRPLGDVFPIVNETTRAPVENPALRALREGRIVGLANHTVLLARDGSERPIDDSGAPIRDATGRIAGAVLVFRDVTEQRRAHRELLASEARKSAILETALDCIMTIDEHGRILEFNPACERTFGRLRAGALGRDVIELLAPAVHRQRVRRDLARLLGDGPDSILGRRVEVRALRADGSDFPIELSVVAIPDGDRPVFTAYLRDIGERKDAERTIQHLLGVERTRSERLARLAAASATINAALTPASVLGVVSREAKLVLEADDATIALDAAAAAGPAGTLSVPLRGRGGHALGTLCLTRDDRPFEAEDAVVLEQLARLAAVALENARLYEELREGDRRKDEFLAMLAHELRNPLAPIRNALRILQFGTDVAAADRARAMIERQVGQMVRLVDDLLDVSRISRGKLTLRRERVELARVIEAALETSRPSIAAGGHELEIALPDEPLWVDGDATRLAQIFLNLLNNAAKYTRSPGRIRLVAERAGDGVAVHVRDTGIGIARDMLPRVFDMFMQVDERSPDRGESGLGIGLTLVKQLVEMHDGTVEARSDGPGTGSEFVVRLPLATIDGAVESRPAEPAPFVGNGADQKPDRRRVLVVDDNLDSVESLGLLLDMMGYEVRTASDGVEALEVAAAFRPEVVLLDLGLPRLSGYEVAERLRELDGCAGAFVVALTGWGQEQDRRRSREAGFDRHLVKPVDPDALDLLLREAVTDTQRA